MKHLLPPLPYEHAALEPHVDARTMAHLEHENRRADYLSGWWSVVNWEEAAGRFELSDRRAEDSWESEGGSLLEATA